MEELIKIDRTGEIETVNARDLHGYLESKQEFSNWIKGRIEKYSFVESQDFLITLSESSGGRPAIEYHLSIDMAKELSMVENNEKGRQARKYFIEVEKLYKQSGTKEISFEEMTLKVLTGLQKKVEEYREKAESYNKYIEADGLFSIKQVSDILNIKGLGQKNLFTFLRDNGVLLSTASNWNLPTREYIESGYFEVKEIYIDAMKMVKLQPYCTQKGIDFIAKKIKDIYGEPTKELQVK